MLFFKCMLRNSPEVGSHSYISNNEYYNILSDCYNKNWIPQAKVTSFTIYVLNWVSQISPIGENFTLKIFMLSINIMATVYLFQS